MRTLLITPTFNYKYTYPSFLAFADFPAGFGYLASALKSAGHEVFGLNPNNDTSYSYGYEMIYDRIQKTLKECQPELIGLGGLAPEYKFVKDAMHIIQQFAPDVPIVVGGGLISNDVESVFNLLKPDFCINGEAEEAIVRLANMLESGKKDFEQIPNLGYWKDGVAKFTKCDFNYMDINQLAFPDYDVFNVKEMLDHYGMASRYICRYTRPDPRHYIIVTARNCPFACTFCVHEKSWRRVYRARTIENVMQELGVMYEKYHFNHLTLLDELFATKKERLQEFTSALLDARKNFGWDFDWFFQTHAAAKLDYETLKMAKAAGCYSFSYGLESASPGILGSMDKKTKPHQIKEAIELAHSVGIGFGGNFIFGDVAETPKTISETMEFFAQNCQSIHLYMDFIQPYPGSELYDEVKDKLKFGDKLKFYENIAERIWNMTSIPDKFWIPWSYLMTYIYKTTRSSLAIGMQSYPWAKPAETLSCIKENEIEGANPMGEYSGKSVYKITVQCPHCNQEAHYRELLGAGNGASKMQQTKQGQPVGLQSILGNMELLRHKLAKKIKRLRLFMRIGVWYLQIFRKPEFKLMVRALKPIMTGKGGGSSFDTGCTKCGKRIKIIVPIKDPRNRMKVMMDQLLFKLIWILSLEPSFKRSRDEAIVLPQKGSGELLHSPS